MDTNGDIRQVYYASHRVFGVLNIPGHAGGGETGHAGGPSIIRFAPPCNHGADLKAIYAGGVVQHSPPSRSGALGLGFSRPAARPTRTGPPL